MRKCFCAWGVGVFTIQEQPYKCYNCKRFLCILANFASGQSHPCKVFLLWQCSNTIEKTPIGGQGASPYYNLSNVTDSVCPLTPSRFMDLRVPNLAGGSGLVTENTSRKRNLKIWNGCHGNQENLLRLRYLPDCADFFMVISSPQ